MVYKRSKRRSRKRRRRSKSSKRRFKSKVARIALNAVKRAEHAQRFFRRHDKGGSMNTDHNTYALIAPVSFMGLKAGTYDCHTVITSPEGQDGAAFIGSSNHTQQHRRTQLYGMKGRIHFRNVSNQPMIFTVWEVLAKKDRSYNANSGTMTPQGLLMDDINAGWDLMTDSTADGYSSLSGNTITLTSKGMYPSQSKFFNENWKIIKKKKLKFLPGDDLFWNVGMRPYIYDASRLDPFSGVGDDNVHLGDEREIDVIKGLTKVVFCQLEGCLGKDTVDHDLTGPMATDVAYETMFQARGYVIETKDHSIDLRMTEDTLTSANLEAATADDMDQDDQ